MSCVLAMHRYFLVSMILRDSIDWRPLNLLYLCLPFTMGVLSQRPTCTNVHMKTTHDAQKILYAVETGHLRKVKHRLSKQHQVHAGDIYVWEEQVAGGQAATTCISMQRFTDPYRWSPSRLRGVRQTLIGVWLNRAHTNTSY